MSNLLHNDHNVYILGAGFSREAGLPLISDFLSQMRDSSDWLVQPNRTREVDAVNKVLKFRLEAAAAAYWVNVDLENIEELFSLAFAKRDDMATSMRIAIAATLDYARKRKGESRNRLFVSESKGLFKKTDFPNWLQRLNDPTSPISGVGTYKIGSYALHVARLLGMLNNGMPKGENTFITFNYDTLLEDALNELKLPVSYGSAMGLHPASQKLSHEITSSDNQTRTLVATNRITAEPIPVLKMHGSLNWSHDSSSGSINIFQNYDELAASALMPELVPPTWKKVFENSIESVWDDAIEKLNTATRIIIIGFSMPETDMHFKYLLAAGLKRNISLRKVLFVNPDADDELKPRAEKMLRQAYVESKQIDFLKETLGQFTASQQLNAVGLQNLGRPIEYGLQYSIFNDS